MTFAATAGTNSCATIAIGGFKAGQKEKNDRYKAAPAAFKPENDPVSNLSVPEFLSKIIYPVSQPLGRTLDLPFTKLMEEIEASGLKGKLTTAVLNHSQFMQDDHYWPKELAAWGFRLADKTRNDIGGAINYLYIRNRNSVPIKEGEA